MNRKYPAFFKLVAFSILTLGSTPSVWTQGAATASGKGSSTPVGNPEPIVPKEALDGRGGGLVAFENEANGDYNFELWIMNADGSAQTRLTNSPGYDGSPSFSPDRKKLLFTSTRDGDAQLFVLDLDALIKGNRNPPLAKLTSTGRNYYPAWSPDNSRIAYSVYTKANIFELYTMDTNGKNARKLVELPNSSHASWSPDGKKLVFVSGIDSGQEIFRVNADGTNPVRLTSNSTSDNMPDWSPKGDMIAYCAGADTYDIWIMDSDGRNPRCIAKTSGLDEFPKWSPDGSRLVYRSSNQLFSMRPDGSDKRQLTSLKGFSVPYDWR